MCMSLILVQTLLGWLHVAEFVDVVNSMWKGGKWRTYVWGCVRVSSFVMLICCWKKTISYEKLVFLYRFEVDGVFSHYCNNPIIYMVNNWVSMYNEQEKNNIKKNWQLCNYYQDFPLVCWLLHVRILHSVVNQKGGGVLSRSQRLPNNLPWISVFLRRGGGWQDKYSEKYDFVVRFIVNMRFRVTISWWECLIEIQLSLLRKQTTMNQCSGRHIE